MAKLEIHFPEKIAFTADLEIRMSDLNHRNHVSAVAFLYLLEDIRMKFFGQFGYNDHSLEGEGVVFGNLQIIYQAEILWGAKVKADITPINFHKYGFDLVYRLYEKDTEKSLLLLKIVCYFLILKRKT